MIHISSQMGDTVGPANRHGQLQAKGCNLVDGLERKGAERYGGNSHCVKMSWKGEFLACKKSEPGSRQMRRRNILYDRVRFAQLLFMRRDLIFKAKLLISQDCDDMYIVWRIEEYDSDKSRDVRSEPWSRY